MLALHSHCHLRSVTALIAILDWVLVCSAARATSSLPLESSALGSVRKEWPVQTYACATCQLRCATAVLYASSRMIQGSMIRGALWKSCVPSRLPRNLCEESVAGCLAALPAACCRLLVAPVADTLSHMPQTVPTVVRPRPAPLRRSRPRLAVP